MIDRAETSPVLSVAWKHSGVETVILLAHTIALLLAIVTFAYDSRLSTRTYQVFVVFQVASLAYQFHRRNYLTFVLGVCLTSMLFQACLIESVADLPFTTWLSEDVYRAEIIQRAYDVLLGTASLFHLVTMLFTPQRVWSWPEPDIIERHIAKKSVLPFTCMALVCFALTKGGSSVTEAQYASIEQHSEAGPLAEVGGGLQLLATYFLCVILVATTREAGYMSRKYVLVVLGVVVAIFYFLIMRGLRGPAITPMALIMLLFVQNSRKPEWGKVILLGILSGIFFVFLQVWGVVRQVASIYGLADAMALGLAHQFDDSVAGFFTPLAITLFSQAYWHLLHIVDLYDQEGISLAGRTFFELIPQAVPGVLAQILGFERPTNVSWLLGEYRNHGGGLYIIAEGYWNAGLLGAFLVALAMAMLCVGAERWVRHERPFLASAYFSFLGSVFFGVFYSLQSFVRALEVTILLLVAFRWFTRLVEDSYSRRLAK